MSDTLVWYCRSCDALVEPRTTTRSNGTLWDCSICGRQLGFALDGGTLDLEQFGRHEPHWSTEDDTPSELGRAVVLVAICCVLALALVTIVAVLFA